MSTAEPRRARSPFFRRWAYRLLTRVPATLQPATCRIKVRSGRIFTLAQPLRTWLGGQLFLYGTTAYEPETVDVFCRLLDHSDVFIDVGAHIGFYTCVAKAYAPRTRVFAFEPHPVTYQLLRASVRLNGWGDVWVEEAALGETEGTFPLYLAASDSEASLNPAFRRESRPVQCRVTTLDHYCDTNDLNRLDVLKLDTESTEPAVLAGGRQVIGDCKPAIICEVLSGITERELTDFLRPLGYRFYQLLPGGPVPRAQVLGDSAYRYLNYLFLADDRVERWHAESAC